MVNEARLKYLTRWIPRNARVLDLGCGDGEVLAALREQLGVRAYGLDIDTDNIIACMRRGVNVIQADLDDGLNAFDDDAFDVVTLEQTLQAVTYPDRLLKEMLRVGREGVVGIPNFGHWKARVQLTLRGRMPVTRSLPSQWYETDNIHLCTLPDFESLCTQLDIEIIERAALNSDYFETPLTRSLPTLCAEMAMYRVRRGSRHGSGR
ncbi:MAG: methionine biosynthesis protein MetW [Gammaproteobacteria bacterium]|nr:methionine biosynthesis protein MetW [Gammaproteobacteria bacterium]